MAGSSQKERGVPEVTRGAGKPIHETIGPGYAKARRPDPRIAELVRKSLGDARTVVNVGAGTGNYEPADRLVLAVDPAVSMLAQRPPTSGPAVLGAAEALPFPDQSFEASLAILTLHHWRDWRLGLREIRRVARRQVVFTYEPAVFRRFWLVDYFPETMDLDFEVSAPQLDEIGESLSVSTVIPVPIPADCTDGFAGAYWQRPQAYLDPSVQGAISCLARLSPEDRGRGSARLADDLSSGAWDARYRYLRDLEEYDLGYRLIIAG